MGDLAIVIESPGWTVSVIKLGNELFNGSQVYQAIVCRLEVKLSLGNRPHTTKESKIYWTLTSDTAELNLS